MAAATASFNIKREAHESELDHLYRLMGHVVDWVFTIDSKNIPDEPNAKAIYNMFLGIRHMPTVELSTELHELLDTTDYRSREMRGCWCRTWCRIAKKELELREEQKQFVENLLKDHFTVRHNADGSVLLY